MEVVSDACSPGPVVCPTMKPVGELDAGNRHVQFDERGRETERCHMAQATAPILDSTTRVDTGRRRRWSEDEKIKIVLESLRAPRRISATARQYGISRSLLIKWRRSFCAKRHDSEEQQVGFVPAMVVAEAAPTVPAVPTRGRMVIVIASGRRVIVDAGVDAAALARVLEVLERR